MTQANKNKKNELVEQQSTAIAAATDDYSAYANQGFESHTRDDYAMPFLGVVQSNSPIIESVAGARPGMLINTVTQDLYDSKKGLIFVPVSTQHVVVEWKPREQGGGFVAIHQLDSELVTKAKAEQEFGKYKTIKGDDKSNDLIETYYVYGLVINEDTGSSEQMICAFTSTKIKVYKRWMTKARTVQVPNASGGRTTLPLFAHKYRVTTVQEKNAKGSFYNLHVEFDAASAADCRLAPNDALFQEAFSFFNIIQQGNIKAAYDTQAQAGEVEEAEIPFK